MTKLYKVDWYATPDSNGGTIEDDGPQVQWCAFKHVAVRFARDQRQRDVEAGHADLDHPQVSSADVPTTRRALASWLNARNVDCWK